MKCPACNSDNREGVIFCEECGAELEIQCPNCNEIIPLGKKFCGQCGHKIIVPEESSKIEYDQPLSYTPKFLADKILTNRSSLEGEHKLVTVLFADVSNYTAMSEKLDPEDVHQIMDTCFQILMDEIHRCEGTINQFTGDGVMALFGAPLAHEDHAQRACHAAVMIQIALKTFAEDLKAQHGVVFKIRIGLNSGSVVVGAIGDDLRMDYTAMGDTTNLAARMESAAEPGTIVAATNTYKLAQGYFDFESLGKLQLKGKQEPQEAYRLIRPTDVETRLEAAAARGLTRFVGRAREVVILDEAYEKAKSGSGQIVGIVGDAGVGKSRLLCEFRKTTLSEQCNYLEGRCFHYGGAMPYLPVLDLLRTYFDIKEDDQEPVIKKKLAKKIAMLHENLKVYLPSFQDILSLNVDDGKFAQIDPGEKKVRVFEAMRDLFIRESENNTLVVAVEDLHWIDRTSEEFISYLIDCMAGSRTLLILLYRPEYTHQWGSKSYYGKLGVDQLSRKTSAELVRAALEDGDVAPELKELVLGRTDGNPLFIEELTQSLIENGSIELKNEKYLLTGDLSEMQMPDTIQTIIAARIDRIDENMKRVLQMASVVGREFTFRIIQNIMEMRKGLKSSLLKLQRLEFIYEKRPFPELEYTFKHALTQEVAYNSLLQKRRKAIHEKIGRAIEAIYLDRIEEYYELLAYHYGRSENKDKAFEFLKRANRKAAKFNAMEEAKSYFYEAMSLLDTLPQTESTHQRRISLIVDQWIVFWLLYRVREYYKLLTKLKPLVLRLANPQLQVAFYNRLAMFEWVFGHFDESIRTLDKSEKICKDPIDVEELSYRYRILLWNRLYKGDYDQVLLLKDDILFLMKKKFNLRTYSWSLCGASWAYSCLGRFDESIAEANKVLKVSEEYLNDSAQSFAAWIIAIAYTSKGDMDKALEFSELGVQKAPTPAEKAWARSALAFSLCRVGKTKKGIELLSELLQSSRDAGFLAAEVRTGLQLGEGYFYAGQYDKANGVIENCLRLAEDTGMKFHIGWGNRLMGEIALKTDPPKAAPHFEKSISIAKQIKAESEMALGYAGYGRYYRQRGNMVQAKDYLTRALDIFKRLGTLLEPEKLRKELSELPQS